MANKRTISKDQAGMPAHPTATRKLGLSRRALLLGSVVVAGGGVFAWNVLGAAQPAKAGTITVWKSPTCGCCGGWVDYMRGKGYQVSVNLVADPDPIKAKLGVPEPLYSCHTARIDDYLVEGHVPEGAVAKLLAERPNVKGIALPGMPDGSPGMDGVPGIYRIVAFDANGRLHGFGEFGV